MTRPSCHTTYLRSGFGGRSSVIAGQSRGYSDIITKILSKTCALSPPFSIIYLTKRLPYTNPLNPRRTSSFSNRASKMRGSSYGWGSGPWLTFNPPLSSTTAVNICCSFSEDIVGRLNTTINIWTESRLTIPRIWYSSFSNTRVWAPLDRIIGIIFDMRVHWHKDLLRLKTRFWRGVTGWTRWTHWEISMSGLLMLFMKIGLEYVVDGSEYCYYANSLPNLINPRHF